MSATLFLLSLLTAPSLAAPAPAPYPVRGGAALAEAPPPDGAGATVAAGPPMPIGADPGEMRWEQVIVRRTVTIRVPARGRLNDFRPNASDGDRPAPPRSVVWREQHAPRCIPMRSLLGVQWARDDSIDLLTSQQQLLRAKLDEDCRALDFHSGFYMVPSSDALLCEGRDVIHSRSGIRCTIDKFRLMVPVRVRE